MFVIGKIQSVKRKVAFKQFSDHGKPAENCDFIVTLKVNDAETTKARRREMQDYVNTLQRELARAQKDPDYQLDLPDGGFDEMYIREDVLDITGCFDLDGVELPFSNELLDAVLLDRPARIALIAVWSELNLEEGGLKRKN